MLWATHGGWAHEFGAIEAGVCVLAPLCASVSSAVLTSWDGTVLNSGAQGRLERRDVIKGTEYLRMETLLLSPPLLTALVGIFYFLLFFFANQHHYNVLSHWIYFPLSPTPPSRKKPKKFICKHVAQSWDPILKTWKFFESFLLKNSIHIERSHKAYVYCLLHICKLNIFL